MDKPPIQSPTDQQAHDKIRGYSFQCWLSVEAWLDLGPKDLLFMECAEDFATFTPTGDANVAQAKATAADITLRSADVAEAINHCWALRVQDQQINVRYSLLTTANITTEQGDPFNGIPGLVFWRQVATGGDETKAEELRKFLVGDPSIGKKLGQGVKDFLGSASSAEFVNKLVRPMIWDTGRDDAAGLRESVESRLAVLAESQFGASSAHRHNLADTLFTRAVTVASSKEKIALTVATLLKTLEAHLVPSELAALVARNQQLLGGLFAGASTLSGGWAFADTVPPIAPPAAFSLRKPAMDALKKQIGTSNFVLIEGSSGMGKSTLAQIHSLEAGGKWLLFRAGDVDATRALRGIQECIALVAREAPPVGLIVDDLPWPSLDGGALNLLRGLARVVRQRGARVIFTNQRGPSASQCATAEMSDMVIVKAPPMVADEVVEVALRLGCTDAKVAIKWAPLVVAQTAGHPRLVHAQLIGLKTRGWPTVSVDEFEAAGAVVQQARDEVQVLLADRRPEEIELLTRLSFFIGSFRKDQAMALATKPDVIGGPTVAFEQLLGPWVETIGTGRFELSPLLGKTLLSGVTNERSQALNAAVVEAVVGCEPVEATDAARALINAIQGLAAAHAAEMSSKFLMAPREHSAALHSHLAWLQFIATEGQPIFPGRPEVDFMIRVLQFEVCGTVAPKRCARFLELCDAAIAAAKDAGTANALRSILAFSFIKANTAPLPFERLFWAIEILRATMTEMHKAEGFEPKALLPPAFNAKSPGDEMEVFVVIDIWVRAGNLAGLRRLLDTLVHATDADRARYLAALTRSKASVILAFDQVWLEEEKKPVRTWDAILGLFYDWFAAAEKWENEIMAACAARGIAIIHNEYQDDPAAAVKELDRVKWKDPEVGAIVSEQRGKIALLAKQYPEAQKHFEATLPHNPWRGFTNTGKVVCYQNAGTAAGCAEDWKASASHFLAGSQLAAAEGDAVRSFAMFVDSAYSLWQTGDRPGAVTRLGEALDLAPALPDPAVDLGAFRALKVFGHLLSHLAWGETGRTGASDASVMLPGMCSDPRVHESIRKMPRPSAEFQEMLYLWLELDYLPQLPSYARRFAALRKVPMPSLQYFLLENEVRRLLRADEYVAILPLALETARSLAVYNNARIDSPEAFTELVKSEGLPPIEMLSPFPVPILLMCVVTVTVFKGANVTALLHAWREAAEGGPLAEELRAFCDSVETAFGAPITESTQAAATHSDDWVRWTHALRVLAEIKPEPNSLLIATVFFVFSRWATTKFVWFKESVALLDREISVRWIRACEQRFAFSMPTLFIPEIKGLAGSPDGSAAHVAKLVMAATPALSVSISQSMLEAVKNVADGKGPIATTS